MINQDVNETLVALAMMKAPVVYWRGNLAKDCSGANGNPNARLLRDAAWSSYLRRQAVLVQRRVGPIADEVCEYIAQPVRA